MIEQTVYDLLRQDSAVSAIVGTRVYMIELPEDKGLPAIVFQRISTAPVTSLNGDSGLDLVRLQISCYATTALVAKQLAAAARACLAAVHSTTVLELDDRDPDTRHFRTLVDVNIWQK